MFGYVSVGGDMTCDRWEGTLAKADPVYTGGFTPHLAEENPQSLIDLLEALEPAYKSNGKLYLISHGKTRYNQPGQPKDKVQGWKNIPLDATGRQQARKIGKFLKNQGVEELYSSDLNRAKQTAEIAGSQLGLDPKTDDSYRPWNLGELAGHSSDEAVPKLKGYMDSPDEGVPGGESFNDFKDRFIPALEKLLKRADTGRTIALVTHSRNIELAQGWIGGRGPRKSVDEKAISQDTVNPAVIMVVSGGKLGKVEDFTKTQANPAEVYLRVNGMTRVPDGRLSYRMVTRDGHYVGRTAPTTVRARKGEVLKVQANDFLQDVNGDIQWMNPEVVSHYDDSPHSFKELEAIAGGILKDGAPGVAGDIPDSPDVGSSPSAEMADVGALAAPEGPTSNSVHVNVPLKNISVAYANKRYPYQIQKADRHRQLLYGVVLEPNVLDSQDDYMLPDQVEKAAHTYMKKVARGKATVSKLQHRAPGFFKSKPGVVPVESYISPIDFSYDGKEMVKKGTWVMVLHVEDPKIWQDVLDGNYTGLSIGGTGIRQEMTVPDEIREGYMAGQQPSDWFR